MTPYWIPQSFVMRVGVKRHPLHKKKSDPPRCLFSSFPRGLADGCYLRRHDKVLKVSEEVLSTAIHPINTTQERGHQFFFQSSQKLQRPPTFYSSRLAGENGSRGTVKVPRYNNQLKFLDIAIFSNSIKQVIMWETTIPLLEHRKEAHEMKLAKYPKLVE